MRILLDTSVLVAAMVEAHPAHEQALPWLLGATNGSHVGLVSAHSLAELYSILTTLPVEPPISPTDALRLIKHNIIGALEIVALSEQDYLEVIEQLAGLGIMGGATYDALIVRSAMKANVEHVVTLNEKDFRRVYPDLADRIVTP